jgi:hypothetical protein
MTARGLASGLASQLASQLAGSGGGGGVSYDADAADYFSRAEALGGSFDLTAISGTYTESYVKTAISDYVAGCKTDGIWSKLTEVYLLSGVTFGGLMAKLKHAGTAAMTNVNFVTGDYLAAGTNAGLTGNASNKRINSNFNVTGLSKDNVSHSVYGKVTGPLTGIFGVRTTDNLRLSFDTTNPAVAGAADLLSVSQRVLGNLPASAFVICSRVSDTSLKMYRNGPSVATITTLHTGDLPNFNYSLFALNTSGSFGFFSGGATVTLVSLGSGLTDSEAANYSTRTNALMTAIGANVY